MQDDISRILAEGGLADAQYISDPAASPYFSAQEHGEGSTSMGGGAGYGWLDFARIPGLEEFAQDPSTGLSGAPGPSVLARLQELGYRIYQQPVTEGRFNSGSDIRGIVGADGRFIGAPQVIERPRDEGFWYAGLAASALAGGAAAGAGGSGAGAAEAGAGAGAGTAPATNAALAESAAGTAGYGASSAGAGGATAGEVASAAGTAGSIGSSGSSGSGGTSSAYDWNRIMSALGGGGGTDWLSLLSGLYGLHQSNRMRDEMDPFREQRQYYGDRLRELEANPSSITRRPGYRAGLDAIGSEMGARGYYGSGNHAVGLSRFAGDFYTQEANRLATLAGAGAMPGAGWAPSMQLAGSSLASLGYAMAPYGNSRPRTTSGGSYYGGGYGQNPAVDPEGQNAGG